jgi:hypothetical protein
VKLLLDENLPHALRNRIAGHDVYTVAYMKWSSFSNGELLALAAADSFDAFISKDQGLAYQQNLTTLPLAVILLRAKSNEMADIEPLLPALHAALHGLKPKVLVVVE